MSAPLIIAGAGQAAAQAIHTLRHRGFDGPIMLVGEEPHPPYQRPPLSKKYLAGLLPRERLFLRPPRFYAENAVELVLGTPIVELDAAARRVRLADGRGIAYGSLLLATGSRARTLDAPGSDLAGVRYLRTVDDADVIAAGLWPDTRVVLVGAGYIGLEVASVLVERGLDVTVLEAADRVMARVVCREVSQFFHDCHSAAGVKIRYRASVEAFAGRDRVEAVRTADGRSIPCDVALVGIGVVPNIEVAQSAGLACDNGILVDEHARTDDDGILAAGDCTNHPHPSAGRRVRLESVQNAIQQAMVAARNLLGEPAAYTEVPWFWSDQYDLKLQIAGLSEGFDDVVLRGDPRSRSFAAYYLRAGELIAVDAVNSPREFMQARKLVAAHARISAAELGDPSTDLGALLEK